MSLNSKVTLSFVAGMIAALLAWAIIDFNGFYQLSGGRTAGSFAVVYREQVPVSIIFGLFVGTALGVISVLGAGRATKSLDFLTGSIVGVISGILGLFFGQLFFGPLYHNPNDVAAGGLGMIIFLKNVIVRAIGWALIGLFIGLGQGIPDRSVKTAKHGAVGGFIGGLVGGTLFELVPWILPPGMLHPGVVSRGISMTVTGACIGLFVGLAQNLFKQAWIRVVYGRNEGKEFIISKPRTEIGRKEVADIGLFGDINVVPFHAMIEALPGGRHMLRDQGSAVGTVVGGQRIKEHMLKDGEVIEISSFKLEFHEKATESRISRPATDVAAKSQAKIPSMPGFCQFCGSKKDANGACACSIGGRDPMLSPQGISPSEPTLYQSAGVPLPSGVGPRLVGVKGIYAGQVFNIPSGGTVNIGRDDSREIVLNMDNTVSRRHARLANENGIFVLYDEGSSNGTFVNGIRVTRQPLTMGDSVEFGSSGFRFEQ